MTQRLFFPTGIGGSEVKAKDPPDAFLFLPDTFGSLGFHNPFVTLFLIRDHMRDTPEDITESAFRWERERYFGEKCFMQLYSEQLLEEFGGL